MAADSGEVPGLLDQILHHRDDVPKGESITQSRERDTRESLLWLKGTEHLPADSRLIAVADQGSDSFEFLKHEVNRGRRFVLRVCKTRKVYAGHDPTGERLYLNACVRSLPELGRFKTDVQQQKGRKAGKQAEFSIRGGPDLICPPHVKYGKHGNALLPMFVVLVSEVNPPAGEKPVEWMLLTNERVQTFAAAWQVTEWYEKRWIV